MTKRGSPHVGSVGIGMGQSHSGTGHPSPKDWDTKADVPGHLGHFIYKILKMEI